MVKVNKTTALILLLLVNAGTFAQENDAGRKFMIEVYAGGGFNQPVRLTRKYITEETSPWYGYESYSAGFGISMQLWEKARIGIGMSLSEHKIGFELSPPIYTEKTIYTETFRIISTPVTYRQYFKYNFYLEGGMIIDFSRKNEPVWLDSQSGLGLTIGAGKEFRIHGFTLDIEPGFNLHSLLPFNGEKFQQRLMVYGISIGLGYSFNIHAGKNPGTKNDDQSPAL